MGRWTEYIYGIYPNGINGLSGWIEKHQVIEHVPGKVPLPPSITWTDALGRTRRSQSSRGLITINSYTDEGKLDTTETQLYNSEKTLRISRSTYHYDYDGNQISETFQDLSTVPMGPELTTRK